MPLYRVCGLQVITAGVIEGRTNARKSNKVPIEPCPVEAKRVSNQDRSASAGDSLHPFRGACHHARWISTMTLQPLSIDAIDGQRIGLKFVRDGAKLSMKAGAPVVGLFVRGAVERTGVYERERQHRVRSGNRAVGLHISREISVDLRFGNAACDAINSG